MITLKQFCIEGHDLDSTLNGPNAEIRFKVAAHDYQFICHWPHGDFCVFGKNECHQIDGTPVIAEVGYSLDFGLLETDMFGVEKYLTNVAPEKWYLETDECYNMEIRQKYNDPWKGQVCINANPKAEVDVGAGGKLQIVDLYGGVEAKGSIDLKLCKDLGKDYDIIYKNTVCPYVYDEKDNIQSFADNSHLCRTVYQGQPYYGIAYRSR